VKVLNEEEREVRKGREQLRCLRWRSLSRNEETNQNARGSSRDGDSLNIGNLKRKSKNRQELNYFRMIAFRNRVCVV
jgi:hypothetical protein